MITCTFAATLEFTSGKSETHRGQVSAPSFPSLFKNAAKELKRAFPGRKWDSCNIVMLERIATS